MAAVSYSDKYIVIDADTMLLRSHDYWINGDPVIRRSNEHGEIYKGFEESIDQAGADTYICHMGSFNKKINYGYFDYVKNCTNKEWYEYIVFYLNESDGLYSEWNSISKYVISMHGYKISHWANKSVDFLSNEKVIVTNWWRDSLSLHRHDN